MYTMVDKGNKMSRIRAVFAQLDLDTYSLPSSFASQMSPALFSVAILFMLSVSVPPCQLGAVPPCQLGAIPPCHSGLKDHIGRGAAS